MSAELAVAEKPLKLEVSEHVESAYALEVKTQEQNELAVLRVRELKQMAAKVKATMDPVVTAALAAHRAAVAARNEHLEPLAQAESVIKEKIGAYEESLERVRDEELRAAQAKAEEEARARRDEEARIAAEEAARASAAVEEQRKAAAAARRAGNDEDADRLQQQAAAQKAEATERAAAAAEAAAAPIVVAVAAPAPAPSKPKGSSVRTDWDIEIREPQKVPRDWCVPDEKAIRQRVKSSDGTIQIPGVINIRKNVVAVRK